MTINGNIDCVLANAEVVAVVGISDKPDRDSFRVAKFLQDAGFTIVPVNPMLKEWEGLQAYENVASIPFHIDIVDIFRRSEFVPDIVDDAIAIGADAVWMQFDVVHEEAARKALEAGLDVVMDRCIKIEVARRR
jgi:predicted CoA-binding protein